MRGPSGRGARRLARAGVLEPYVEHGKQAQRSPGGRMACFDRRVVRNAGWQEQIPQATQSITKPELYDPIRQAGGTRRG